MVLGEKGGGYLVAEDHLALVRRFLGGDEAAEGRFARAVGPYDGEFLAFVDLEIEAVEDLQRPVGFRHALDFCDCMAGVRRWGEAEVHHRIILLGRGDALDLGQQLNPGLH